MGRLSVSELANRVVSTAPVSGSKADTWWLRQCPKVMNLPFKEGIRRADRDNTIDVYISDDHDDVLRDGVWQQFFTEKPAHLLHNKPSCSACILK